MALLEFRSKAAGGFFLMPETFREICKVVSRPYSESGSWPKEDLKEILSRLDAEIARETATLSQINEESRQRDLAGREYLSFEEEDELQRVREKRVSFRMRTFPLRGMLEAAIKKDVPIMWGVP